MFKNIAIIGSGNLAYNLAHNLKQNSFKISLIISRKIENAKELAQLVEANYSDHIIIEKETVYFICTPDDTIEQIAQNLKNLPIVHCAGSKSIDILAKYSESCGVFYPFHSFTKNKIQDFRKIPLFVEYFEEKMGQYLKNLASKMSDKVFELNSEERMILHISAVFANNFVNHLLYIASKNLETINLDLSIVEHLIKIATEIAPTDEIKKRQTGPAVRFDNSTIKSHLSYLENKNISFANVYEAITKSIFTQYCE